MSIKWFESYLWGEIETNSLEYKYNIVFKTKIH